MSSILTMSSSSSAAVMAPPSMASFSSMRKQVVRCRGSSPPWQPRTLIFISVPEPLFHLEKLEVFLHFAGIGNEHALRDQGDDPRLGGLVDRLLDLLRAHAHPHVQLVQVHSDQLALRGVLSPLQRRLPEIMYDAAVRVAHQELRVLRHHGARGTRLVVQDAHLAEELTGAQGRENLLGFPNGLGDVHLPGLDDVHLLAGFAFPEKDVAAPELPPESLEESVLSCHAEVLPAESSTGQFSDT